MLSSLLLACAFTLARVPSYALVSFYGGEDDDFDGKETSCGEIFDKDAMTFAHKELPPGSLVEFRYMDRRVVGLGNDDGPYCGDREFDLSEALFEELVGNLDVGVVEVEYRVLSYKPRATMQWNLYGTDRYDYLFRDEIDNFIENGSDNEVYKQLRPTRYASISHRERPVCISWGYFGY